MAVRFQGFKPRKDKKKTPGVRPRAIKSLVHFDPTLDDNRRYITDCPTPEQLSIWLRSVDDGDIAALVEMSEEMIAKDAHLFGVAQTRRGAVTALDWEIVPNEDDEDTATAEEKANYCTKQLRCIPNFHDVLDHLATAIGPNVAVLELLWDRAEIVGIVPVPGHRLTGDPSGLRPGVFVETTTSLGVPTKPGKWVVHHPNPNGGFPFRMTLTHATVWPWIMQHYTQIDWMAYSELYGHPIRLTKFTEESTSEDRTQAATMFRTMGSDVAGSFPEGITPELLQASGDGEIFKTQAAWAARQISIAWLGQTLTTDVGESGGGAFALGKIHDNVRSDLLAMDLKAERRTMEGQLLAPMVGLRFPNNDGPPPTWRRVIEDKRDFDAERIGVENLKSAIELGFAVKVDEAYSALSLERPADDETDVIGAVMRAEAETAEPEAEV